jgi:hypothetical protein
MEHFFHSYREGNEIHFRVPFDVGMLKMKWLGRNAKFAHCSIWPVFRENQMEHPSTAVTDAPAIHSPVSEGLSKKILSTYSLFQEYSVILRPRFLGEVRPNE